MLIYWITDIIERLTQMTMPCQTGVKAHLLHLVSPPHEEIDDGVSYHTVGKVLNNMVVTVSDM